MAGQHISRIRAASNVGFLDVLRRGRLLTCLVRVSLVSRIYFQYTVISLFPLRIS